MRCLNSLISLSGPNSLIGRVGLTIRAVPTFPTVRAIPTIQTVFILIVAFGLRLIALGSRSLWYDEAFAVLFAEKGFSAMLAGTLTQSGGAAADVHPILYYTGLWGWMKVFGAAPVMVRLPGVFAGLVTIALGCRLAGELLGRKAARAGAIFLALSPFLVHYSQEARMYSFLALWLTAATWAYLRAVRGGSNHVSRVTCHVSRRSHSVPWYLAFAIFAALGQYTHNLAWLYLVALALTPLWLRRWRDLAHTVLAGLLAVLLYLPWLLNAPGQFAKIRLAYWTARPEPAQLLTTLTNITVNLPLSGLWLAAGLSAAVLAGVLGVYQVAKWNVWEEKKSRVRRELKEMREGRGTLVGPGWLLYLGLFPALLMFLVSQIVPVYIDRALLPAAGMYLLALSWALTGSDLPRAISVFTLVILVIAAGAGLIFHYHSAGFPNSSFAELDRYLGAVVRPGDKILHSNKLSFFPAHYYDRALAQSFLADPPGSGSDTLALPTQQALGLFAVADPAQAVGEAGKVWFVIYDRAVREYQALGFADHPHLAYLRTQFTYSGSRAFDDLQVYEFTR